MSDVKRWDFVYPIGMKEQSAGEYVDWDDYFSLRAELEHLQTELREIRSQADEGLRADHECPAVFACACILNDATEALRATERGADQPREPLPVDVLLDARDCGIPMEPRQAHTVVASRQAALCVGGGYAPMPGCPCRPCDEARRAAVQTSEGPK